MSKYLLGALALVAVGLLIVSGEWGSQGQGRELGVPLIVPSSPQVASTTQWMVSRGDCPARAGYSPAAAWTFSHGQTSLTGSSPGPMENVVSRDVAAGEQELPLPTDGNVRRWSAVGLSPSELAKGRQCLSPPGAPILPLPQDSQQKAPSSDARDPQSVQSVSLLLDKLAKENQEIRLMQAELQVGERCHAWGNQVPSPGTALPLPPHSRPPHSLPLPQAHKEELHALLQKSEGEPVAAGAQQQSLAAENARLRAALEREAAALRDAQAELQHLRAAGAPGSPRAGEPVAQQPPSTGASAHGEDAARREGTWQHGWLALVRQELVGALERARGPGGLEGLVEELRTLEQRLGRELEAAKPFPGPWKKPFKAEKKESRRHKRHGAGGGPHERERREQTKPHAPGKDHRFPREHKPGKAWGKSSHGPPQHGPRKLPPLSWYQAPQGCSGVADCARKEGREVLGAALKPVQKAEFLRLLEGFMGRLGWGGHFRGLAARLDGAFGADGTFAHDRLRFVDFVDDVEELLEEVARQERGNEEAADGFEEYVLRHYAGDGG